MRSSTWYVAWSLLLLLGLEGLSGCISSHERVITTTPDPPTPDGAPPASSTIVVMPPAL